MDIKETFLALLEHRYRNEDEKALTAGRPPEAPTLYPPIVFEGFLEIGLRKYAGYEGIDPGTKEKIEVSERFLVSLRADKIMAGYLNSQTPTLQPIQVREDFGGINLQELLQVLGKARDQLMANQVAEIPSIVTLGTKTKKDRSGQEQNILVVNNPRDRDENPNDPWICFQDELDQKLKSNPTITPTT